MIVLGFVAGVLGVLVFHQGTAFLLHTHGARWPELAALIGRVAPPFSMAQVAPFGVPVVASQAFWGGLWGIALAALLRCTRWPDLLTGFLFGAVVVTLVGFTLMAQLKGLPWYAGGNQQAWWRAGLLNGAFGWGAAFVLRPLALRG